LGRCHGRGAAWMASISENWAATIFGPAMKQAHCRAFDRLCLIVLDNLVQPSRRSADAIANASSTSAGSMPTTRRRPAPEVRTTGAFTLEFDLFERIRRPATRSLMSHVAYASTSPDARVARGVDDRRGQETTRSAKPWGQSRRPCRVSDGIILCHAERKARRPGKSRRPPPLGLPRAARGQS
jgi:hypothetical protein